MVNTTKGIKSAKALLLCGLSVVALGACSMVETKPNAVTVASQSFAHMEQTDLNVSELHITVDPIISNETLLALFPNDPEQAFNSYLRSRFKSTMYGDGILNLSITDSEFTRIRVSGNKSKMFDNLLDYNDNYKYTLKSTISVEAKDRHGRNREATSFDISKSLVMPSHFSLARKEKHTQEFLNDYIAEMDAILSGYVSNSIGVSPAYLTTEYGDGHDGGEGGAYGYRYQDRH